MAITQIGGKKSWGNRVCLGDLMQNIAIKNAWTSFACFRRRAWGEFYKHWLKSNKF